jgi:hypothetical protein
MREHQRISVPFLIQTAPRGSRQKIKAAARQRSGLKGIIA